MGKFNFNTQKIDEIMQRLEALEKANNELRKENAALRNNRQLTPVRLITADIENIDKASQLFGITSKSGEIVKDDTAFKNNFSVFYQNIFRALNPAPRINKGNETLRYTPVNTLTDDEYKVYIDTLDIIIDTIYYAKDKLKGMNGNVANT